MKQPVWTIKLTDEKAERLIGMLHDLRLINPDAVEIAHDICSQLYNRPTDAPVYTFTPGHVELPERRPVKSEIEKQKIETITFLKHFGED